MSIDNNVLRELQRLIENADPRDFIIGSRSRGISNHMKSAMELLALECLVRSTDSRTFKPPQHSKPTRQRNRIHRSVHISSSPKTGTQTEVDQIYEILVNSKRLSNKTEMLDFAKYAGIQINFSKKESRLRVAKRLAKAIASSPDKIKDRCFSLINGMVGDQTQGWFDIILKK